MNGQTTPLPAWNPQQTKPLPAWNPPPSANYTAGLSSQNSMASQTGAISETGMAGVVPTVDPYTAAINSGVAVLDAGLGIYAANEEREAREEAKREARQLFERNWQLAAEERRKRDYLQSRTNMAADSQFAQNLQDRGRMNAMQSYPSLSLLGKV